MWNRISGNLQNTKYNTSSEGSRRYDRAKDPKPRNSGSTVSSTSNKTSSSQGDARKRGFNPASTSYSSSSRSQFPGTAPASIEPGHATASGIGKAAPFVAPELIRNASLAQQMPRSKPARDGRGQDQSQDFKRQGERYDKTERSRSHDRNDSKREKQRRRGKKDSDIEEGRVINRSGTGLNNGDAINERPANFASQAGSGEFSQLPGQNDDSLPGSNSQIGAYHGAMSSHVQDQFPGQFPNQSTAPYRPPLAANEGGPGLAAEYYGDAGESVTEQPGNRTGTPSLIIGAEPHLLPASSVPAPPPEPSASGGVGAAASFFNGSFDGEEFDVSQSQHNASTYASVSNRPDTSHHSSSAPVIPTIGGAALGVAAGYLANSESSSHQGRSEHTLPVNTSLNELPSFTTQQPPAQYQNSSHHTNVASATKPGRHSSQSSNYPMYAAGGTGLAANTHEASHHSASQHISSKPPYRNTPLAQRRRHHGPLSAFVDFFKDPEGVAQFEEYTELIGVCKYCFAPGSSPRDAPRKHFYARRGSHERLRRSTRVDKDNRYSSSDSDSRRSKNKSWLATGLAGYGLGKFGESIFKQSNDFDDTYSVKTGRFSPQGRSHTSQTSLRNMIRPRSRSTERVETGMMSDGSTLRSDPRVSHFGSTTSTYGTRRRSRSKSCSRDRIDGGGKAAIGAAIGSSLLASNSRHRSHSPGEIFLGNKHSSRNRSSERRRKSHKKKKDKGFFNLGERSSSSSSIDLEYSTSHDKRNNKKRSKVKAKDDEKAEAALLGLGAAAAALTSSNGHRRHPKKGVQKLVGVKKRDRKGDNGSETDHRAHTIIRSSDEGLWESAPEDEFESANSDLAYGTPVRSGSQESLKSDSSGTNKWGWRWGSKTKRRNSPSHRESADHGGLSTVTGAADISLAGEAMMSPSQYEKKDTDSTGSARLKHVYPMPTSDPSRFDVGGEGSIASSSRPFVVSQPEAVPIQHPQPITPLSSAIYTGQTSYDHAYSTPTGPPVFSQQDYITQPTLAQVHPDISQYDVFDAFSQKDQKKNDKVRNFEPRRRDSSPARFGAESQFNSANPRRRAFTRSNTSPSSVHFDLSREQEDKDRLKKSRKKREYQERPGSEEHEQLERETRRSHSKSSKKPETTVGLEHDSGRTSGISWVAPAAAGVAGAVIGAAVTADGSKSEEEREQRRERRQRERERDEEEQSIRKRERRRKGQERREDEEAMSRSDRRRNGKEREDKIELNSTQSRRREQERNEDSVTSKAAERLPDAVSEVYGDLDRQSRSKERSKSVWQEAASTKRSSSHENYGDFFVPTEFLGRSNDQIKISSANSDADIDLDHHAAIVEVEPKRIRDLSTSPASSPVDIDNKVDSLSHSFPWQVPRLRLVEPTPPSTRGSTPVVLSNEASDDHSEGNTVDVSPPTVSSEDVSTFDNATITPQGDSEQPIQRAWRESICEDQADVPTSHDEHNMDQTMEQETRASTNELPGNLSTSLDNDIGFAATLAATAEDAGFDPSIVVDDPVYRRQESPTTSEERSMPGGFGTDEEVILSKKEQKRQNEATRRQADDDTFDCQNVNEHVQDLLSQQDDVEPSISQHASVDGTREWKVPEKSLSKKYKKSRKDPKLRFDSVESFQPENRLQDTESQNGYGLPLEDSASIETSASIARDTGKRRKSHKSPKRGVSDLEEAASLASLSSTNQATDDVQPEAIGEWTSEQWDRSPGRPTGSSSKESGVRDSTDGAIEGDIGETKWKSEKSGGRQIADDKTSSYASLKSSTAQSLGRNTQDLFTEVHLPAPLRYLSLEAVLIRSKDQGTNRNEAITVADAGSVAQYPDNANKSKSTKIHQSESFLGTRPEPPPPPDMTAGSEDPLDTVDVYDSPSAPVHQSDVHQSFDGYDPGVLNDETGCPHPQAISDLPSTPLPRPEGHRSPETRVLDMNAERKDQPDPGALDSTQTTPVYLPEVSRRFDFNTSDPVSSSGALPSPTAVPFHFRRPRPSSGSARSLSQTPFSSSHEIADSLPKQKTRPRSTEFKSSKEFRPLWLVERHRSHQEPGPDEAYPSLPSSRTTSCDSSVHGHQEHDDERPEQEMMEARKEPPGIESELLPNNDNATKLDLLDSKQVTPTASSFHDSLLGQGSYPVPHSEPSSPKLASEEEILRNTTLRDVTIGAAIGGSLAYTLNQVNQHLESSKPELSREEDYQYHEGLDDIALSGRDDQILELKVGIDQDFAPQNPKKGKKSKRKGGEKTEEATSLDPVGVWSSKKSEEQRQPDPQEARKIQEQDAQDAVDSWFSSVPAVNKGETTNQEDSFANLPSTGELDRGTLDPSLHEVENTEPIRSEDSQVLESGMSRDQVVVDDMAGTAENFGSAELNEAWPSQDTIQEPVNQQLAKRQSKSKGKSSTKSRKGLTQKEAPAPPVSTEEDTEPRSLLSESKPEPAYDSTTEDLGYPPSLPLSSVELSPSAIPLPSTEDLDLLDTELENSSSQPRPFGVDWDPFYKQNGETSSNNLTDAHIAPETDQLPSEMARSPAQANQGFANDFVPHSMKKEVDDTSSIVPSLLQGFEEEKSQKVPVSGERSSTMSEERSGGTNTTEILGPSGDPNLAQQLSVKEPSEDESKQADPSEMVDTPKRFDSTEEPVTGALKDLPSEDVEGRGDLIPAENSSGVLEVASNAEVTLKANDSQLTPSLTEAPIAVAQQDMSHKISHPKTVEGQLDRDPVNELFVSIPEEADKEKEGQLEDSTSKRKSKKGKKRMATMVDIDSEQVVTRHDKAQPAVPDFTRKESMSLLPINSDSLEENEPLSLTPEPRVEAPKETPKEVEDEWAGFSGKKKGNKGEKQRGEASNLNPAAFEEKPVEPATQSLDALLKSATKENFSQPPQRDDKMLEEETKASNDEVQGVNLLSNSRTDMQSHEPEPEPSISSNITPESNDQDRKPAQTDTKILEINSTTNSTGAIESTLLNHPVSAPTASVQDVLHTKETQDTLQPSIDTEGLSVELSIADDPATTKSADNSRTESDTAEKDKKSDTNEQIDASPADTSDREFLEPQPTPSAPLVTGNSDDKSVESETVGKDELELGFSTEKKQGKKAKKSNTFSVDELDREKSIQSPVPPVPDEKLVKGSEADNGEPERDLPKQRKRKKSKKSNKASSDESDLQGPLQSSVPPAAAETSSKGPEADNGEPEWNLLKKSKSKKNKKSITISVGQTNLDKSKDAPTLPTMAEELVGRAETNDGELELGLSKKNKKGKKAKGSEAASVNNPNLEGSTQAPKPVDVADNSAIDPEANNVELEPHFPKKSMRNEKAESNGISLVDASGLTENGQAPASHTAIDESSKREPEAKIIDDFFKKRSKKDKMNRKKGQSNSTSGYQEAVNVPDKAMEGLQTDDKGNTILSDNHGPGNTVQGPSPPASIDTPSNIDLESQIADDVFTQTPKKDHVSNEKVFSSSWIEQQEGDESIARIAEGSPIHSQQDVVNSSQDKLVVEDKANMVDIDTSGFLDQPTSVSSQLVEDEIGEPQPADQSLLPANSKKDRKKLKKSKNLSWDDKVNVSPEGEPVHGSSDLGPSISENDPSPDTLMEEPRGILEDRSKSKKKSKKSKTPSWDDETNPSPEGQQIPESRDLGPSISKNDRSPRNLMEESKGVFEDRKKSKKDKKKAKKAQTVNKGDENIATAHPKEQTGQELDETEATSVFQAGVEANTLSQEPSVVKFQNRSRNNRSSDVPLSSLTAEMVREGVPLIPGHDPNIPNNENLDESTHLRPSTDPNSEAAECPTSNVRKSKKDKKKTKKGRVTYEEDDDLLQNAKDTATMSISGESVEKPMTSKLQDPEDRSLREPGVHDPEPAAFADPEQGSNVIQGQQEYASQIDSPVIGSSLDDSIRPEEQKRSAVNQEIHKAEQTKTRESGKPIAQESEIDTTVDADLVSDNVIQSPGRSIGQGNRLDFSEDADAAPLESKADSAMSGFENSGAAKASNEEKDLLTEEGQGKERLGDENYTQRRSSIEKANPSALSETPRDPLFPSAETEIQWSSLPDLPTPSAEVDMLGPQEQQEYDNQYAKELERQLNASQDGEHPGIMTDEVYHPMTFQSNIDAATEVRFDGHRPLAKPPPLEDIKEEPRSRSGSVQETPAGPEDGPAPSQLTRKSKKNKKGKKEQQPIIWEDDTATQPAEQGLDPATTSPSRLPAETVSQESDLSTRPLDLEEPIERRYTQEQDPTSPGTNSATVHQNILLGQGTTGGPDDYFAIHPPEGAEQNVGQEQEDLTNDRSIAEPVQPVISPQPTWETLPERKEPSVDRTLSIARNEAPTYDIEECHEPYTSSNQETQQPASVNESLDGNDRRFEPAKKKSRKGKKSKESASQLDIESPIVHAEGDVGASRNLDPSTDAHLEEVSTSRNKSPQRQVHANERSPIVEDQPISAPESISTEVLVAAAGLGAGVIASEEMERRNSKKKGKNGKNAKRVNIWEQTEEETSGSGASIHQEPLQEVSGRAPTSEQKSTTTMTQQPNDTLPQSSPPLRDYEPTSDKADIQDLPQSSDSSHHRDSAIHISKSPAMSEQTAIHRAVRDSGDADPEGSSVLDIEPQHPNYPNERQTLGAYDQHDTEAYDHGVQSDDRRISESEVPLRIPMDVNPDLDVPKPRSRRRRSMRKSGASYDSDDSADSGFDVQRRRRLQATDQEPREPSAVSSTTKDRSSILFDSSPGVTRTEYRSSERKAYLSNDHLQEEADASPSHEKSTQAEATDGLDFSEFSSILEPDSHDRVKASRGRKPDPERKWSFDREGSPNGRSNDRSKAFESSSMPESVLYGQSASSKTNDINEGPSLSIGREASLQRESKNMSRGAESDHASERASKPFRGNGPVDEHESPHTSLFGGPIDNDESPLSPPRSPPDSDGHSHSKLEPISEDSRISSPSKPKDERDIWGSSLSKLDTRLPSHSAMPPRVPHTQQSLPNPKDGPGEYVSTDHLISRRPWPAVDEEEQHVDLSQSKSRKGDWESSHEDKTSTASDMPQPQRHERDNRSASAASGDSNSIRAIIRTPDYPVRSASGQSFRSSGTPPLRRVDRSASGDLRGASQKSEAKSRAKSQTSETASHSHTLSHSPSIPSSSTYDPVTDKGKGRADMADVYVSHPPSAFTCARGHLTETDTPTQEGWGDVRGQSPMSPTRPPSMRKRQSMQLLDLETRLDQLVSENRLLQNQKMIAERNLQDQARDHSQERHAYEESIQEHKTYLAQKDSELGELRESIDDFRNQLSHLREVNEDLASSHSLAVEQGQKYGQLEAEHALVNEQWQQSARELDDLRQQHDDLRQQHRELATGMDEIVSKEVGIVREKKDRELQHLRDELEVAKQQVRSLQQQITASKASDDYIERDEDYFDGQCQALCQHVQQWVLRFSKFSDMKSCRLASEVSDEKTVERMENAILDGSDVDNYLSDRVKRRDVFMSVVMTMIWEYIFTRYLFGMDRDQRQKLKHLEKTLQEVGPMAAVHKWRATTLTLLMKRESFASQRATDTEAVLQEVFDTLAMFLPPPSHLVGQIQDSLRKVINTAVDLSIEMRTQRSEYSMLPPLQPEYDTNGDLAGKVHFSALTMNERSGATSSNEALQEQQAIVRMVLFPLVVKNDDDDEQIVVCPAQVLTAETPKGKKTVRVISAHGGRSEASFAGSDVRMEGGMI